MQNPVKPQVEASLNAAFELANLTFSQVERLTELSFEQAKVNAELAQEQLASVLQVKDPAAALALLQSQLETSAKSLAGFATTAFELTQEFQAESAAFAEGHFDHAHAAANQALYPPPSRQLHTSDTRYLPKSPAPTHLRAKAAAARRQRFRAANPALPPLRDATADRCGFQPHRPAYQAA